MNVIEQKAFEWLKGQGAKEIRFQRRASPDFITDIGLFEVKTVNSGVISFTPNQFHILTGQKEVKYLIYTVGNSEPLLLTYLEIKRKFTLFNKKTSVAFSYKEKVIQEQQIMSSKKEDSTFHGCKCPNCQSEQVVKLGFITNVEGKKQRYKCQNCGKTFYEEAKQ
jgi:ribosomal protein S27E